MKRYRTILADPPWNQTGGGKIVRGAQKHYPVMKSRDIKELMVQTLEGRVEDDAHCYIWVTGNQLPDGLDIMAALGFRYITNLCWAKTSFGLGQYFRGQHELVLFGVRGKPAGVMTEHRDISSLLGRGTLPKARHSQKPEEMYELVERRSRGPYLEMFARRPRTGWDCWGNEVGLDLSDDGDADDVLERHKLDEVGEE